MAGGTKSWMRASAHTIATGQVDRGRLLLAVMGAKLPRTDARALRATYSYFDVWPERLRQAEIEIESVVTWPQGGKSLYFRDPDGHAIELKTSNWDGKEVVS